MPPDHYVVPSGGEGLHKLPPTHELTLRVAGDADATKRGLGLLTIHLLGFVTGRWLQFDDWWFDRRVLLEPTHNVALSDSVIEDFLHRSIDRVRLWTTDQQTAIMSLLFMHCRTPTYGRDWERFIIEYTVTDACFSLAAQIYGTTANGHAERFDALCNTFGIQSDDRFFAYFVELRNGLIHNSLWNLAQPGTVNPSRPLDTHSAPLLLRRFNQRVIPALLGYGSPHGKGNWWEMGTFPFDPPAGFPN